MRRDGSGVETWYEQQAEGDYVVWALHFDAATGVVTQRQVGPEIADPISDVSVAVAAGSRYLGQCRGREAEVVAALNDVLIISKRPYEVINGPAMVIGCIKSRLVIGTLVVAIDVDGRKPVARGPWPGPFFIVASGYENHLSIRFRAEGHDGCFELCVDPDRSAFIAILISTAWMDCLCQLLTHGEGIADRVLSSTANTSD